MKKLAGKELDPNEVVIRVILAVSDFAWEASAMEKGLATMLISEFIAAAIDDDEGRSQAVKISYFKTLLKTESLHLVGFLFL